MIRRLLDQLYLWSSRLAAVFLAAICLLVLCQVCCNLVDRLSTLVTGSAIGLTIPSYADFTGFFLAASSFLALAGTLRSGSHIRVTLLLAHLGEPWRRLLEIGSLVLACAASLYFAWFTVALVWESYSYHDLSPGMVAVPLWIPQSAMLLGLIVLSIALIDDLCSLLAGRGTSYQEESAAALPSGKGRLAE